MKENLGLPSKSAMRVRVEYDPSVPLDDISKKDEVMEVDSERQILVANPEKVSIFPVSTFWSLVENYKKCAAKRI